MLTWFGRECEIMTVTLPKANFDRLLSELRMWRTVAMCLAASLFLGLLAIMALLRAV